MAEIPCPTCKTPSSCKVHEKCNLRPQEASSLPVVISTAPERIYLVIGEDCPLDARWDQLAEVTWCEDNIDGNGVVYERSDLAQSQLTALRAEKDHLIEVIERRGRMIEECHAELDALKAAPVVDVEAIMTLADEVCNRHVLFVRDGHLAYGTAYEAARSALRSAIEGKTP